MLVTALLSLFLNLIMKDVLHQPDDEDGDAKKENDND